MANGILLTRHNQEITQWSPDLFPCERVGSGYETTFLLGILWGSGNQTKGLVFFLTWHQERKNKKSLIVCRHSRAKNNDNTRPHIHMNLASRERISRTHQHCSTYCLTNHTLNTWVCMIFSPFSDYCMLCSQRKIPELSVLNVCTYMYMYGRYRRSENFHIKNNSRKNFSCW